MEDCKECEMVVEKKTGMGRTHRDMIDFGGISEIVVMVQCFLSHSQSSTNRGIITSIDAL
jgi:hypothetical protein